MTIDEFRNGFDLKFNNIMSNQAPGLDDYEISYFLTEAQDSLVKDLYTGRNSTFESFENTEMLRRCLAELVSTAKCEVRTDAVFQHVVKDSTLYNLPEGLWFIIYEWATFKTDDDCINAQVGLVKPVGHDELNETLHNPFKKPARNRVLRLDVSENVVELISRYPIDEYKVRYVSRPAPIILVDLQDGLTIHGKSTAQTCTLNPVVHQEILDRAVRLAAASYSGTGTS